MSWLKGQQFRNSVQMTGHGRRGYIPTQCRTRKCTEPYGHGGPHTGQPANTHMTVRANTGQGNRLGRRAARRAAGAHGVNHAKLTRTSPKAAPVPGARERMAAIREGDASKPKGSTRAERAVRRDAEVRARARDSA